MPSGESTNWKGGYIFPIMFASVALGLAVDLLFPGIPVAVTVAATMAGALVAALKAPLFSALFTVEVAAAERFYTRIEVVLGIETASFIQDSVSAISAANEDGLFVLSEVRVVSLLLLAMGLFLQLKYVLNRIWGIPLGKYISILSATEATGDNL